MDETTQQNIAAADTQPTSPSRLRRPAQASAGTDDEEFSAAAPPDPEAPGTGETSFSDAEAPPAGTVKPPAEDDTQRTSSAGTGEAARYLELAKRTQADFENYRKRMARENAAASDRGAAKLAKELLPALDHLEIALKEASTQPTSSAGTGGHQEFIKGFALVRDELIAALGKSGIQAFSPKGERFDPNEHEAMAQQPSAEAESGTVLEVYQLGFRINGQILRPARVVVAQ